MEIAPEHADAVGQRAGMRVEERLLLDRVALDPADVAPRHVQHAAAHEADLADAGRPLRDRAFVPARVTPDAVLRNPLGQFRRRLGRSRLE
jgi:hypothetical protein